MSSADPIYLDYAATTPLDPSVREALLPYLDDVFGNPNSLHQYGQKALVALDTARERMARILGAYFGEILFTGSATEANNMFLRGVCHATEIAHPKILVSSIEHKAILETARALAADGVEVVELPVTPHGHLNVDAFKAALDDRTVAVSVMLVNNEIGTIQPLQELSSIINAHRREHDTPYPLFHTDAVQAFQHLPIKPELYGVDAMTFSAHKCYGPKGVGILYLRDLEGALIDPLITGGGQEFGMRAGTQNVPGIIGAVEAMALADELREAEAQRLEALGAHLMVQLHTVREDISRNGDAPLAPHIYNIHVPGVPADELVIKLDMHHVAVSGGSACRARALEPSYVISALGNEQRARESIRISLGRATTEKEIDEFVNRFRMVL